MDIFEYAMQMEKDGWHLYHELAKKSDDEGVRNIFNMLEDDEVKHYKVFESMKKEEKPAMADTTVLTDAKNIFAQLREEKKFDYNLPEIDLYKKAQELEKRSRDFYLEKAEEVKDEYQKEMFLKIAEEEKKHYYLLDNIIEFVSKPQFYLENAEFSNLEEY
ncbi:MAG: ferritin family protein [Candidatus Omnitrophota bacterium]